MNIVFHTPFSVFREAEKESSFFGRLFFSVAASMPEHHFFLLSGADSKPFVPLPDNVQVIQVSSWMLHPATAFLYKKFLIPREIKRLCANVIVSEKHLLSSSTPIPQFLFVPDENYHASMQRHAHKRIILEKKIKRSAKKTSCLFFSSAVKQQQTIGTLSADTLKTTVVYPFLSASFAAADEEKKEATKARWTKGVEYFYCSDALLTKSSFVFLLKAFSAFKKRLKSNMKLLLAIGKNSNEKDILHRLATYRYKDDVVLCLSVSETERIALIASSYAMICLGERSGYSIPLAEALCCSVPIIAADNPLFREIGGAGVLYFEENNLQDLSQNMMLLYKDEDLRTRCVHEIENRKLIFSEKNIVDQLRNLLLSASDNESPTFAV